LRYREQGVIVPPSTAHLAIVLIMNR